jgi:putative oxidoreductase
MIPEGNDKKLLLLARILVALLFLYSGVGKILAPSVIIGAIAGVGLPLPQFCYAVAVVVELGASIAFLVEFKPRIAALALGAYCVLTGILFHFDFAKFEQNIQLLKNLAITGGLLYYFVSSRGFVSGKLGAEVAASPDV